MASLLLLLGGFFGQQHCVDVGQHTAGGDGDLAQQLAELLVVAHSQLDVAGHDAGLLVVPGSVTGQLQDLSREVLQHGSQIDGCAGTDAGGVLALLQVAGDTTHGELQMRRVQALCSCILSCSIIVSVILTAVGL